MESLPGNKDNQADILWRLPTKSLLYLKLVSKDLRNCISDLMSENSFTKKQLKKEQTCGFIFQERYHLISDYDISVVRYITAGKEGVDRAHRAVFDFLPESVVVQASCHGLICCRSCFCSDEQKQLHIYVCNPINKEWIRLPFLHSLDTKSSLALAFDPFSDHSTNFKVVRVYEANTDQNDGSSFVFDIYSSENQAWNTSKVTCQCHHKLVKNTGLFVEGCLYWLTDGEKILMFDPENELSLLIATPLPRAVYRSMPELCLGESEGKLCCVVVSVDGLEQWVLEDKFTSFWKREYSVALELLETKHRSFPNDTQKRIEIRPLVPLIDPLVLTNGQLLMRVSEDIFVYDFKTGVMKLLCKYYVLGIYYACSPIVLPYTASLVQLWNA